MMVDTPQPAILVVDDNEANRYSVCRILKGAGFKTAEAGSGEETFQALCNNHPELILLDVHLPDILGFEICRRIRASHETRSIPVVMLSASFIGMDARIAGLEGGADAYLAQPVSPEELVATVKAVLRTRQLQREAHADTSRAQETRDELNRLLQALAEKNLTLQAFLDASPLAIVVCDLQAKVLAWNTAAEHIFGWKTEEVVGRKFPFLSVRLQTEHQSILQRMKRGETLAAVESLGKRKDGTEFPVVTWFAQLTAATGQVTSFFMIFQDTTERVSAEEALRTSDRFAAQGRMASMLAHEINNPLTAVMNAIYLLKERKDLNVEAAAHVRTASTELARIAHISRHIFSLYHESDAIESVNIGQMVDELLEAYRENAAARRITIRRRYRSSASVAASRAEVRHLLANILANAFEHVGNDGIVMLRVGSGWSSKAPFATGCRLLIADTGPGIAPSNLKSIFEPFFTTKEQRGTGLGLWVAKGIIEKLGGRIRVRSRVGPSAHGTCVSVFLPCRPALKRKNDISMRKTDFQFGPLHL